MERILLLAKHNAICSSSDLISAHHVLWAASSLRFIDNDNFKKIKLWAGEQNESPQEVPPASPDQIIELIETSRRKPKIKFSEAVSIWILKMGGVNASVTYHPESSEKSLKQMAPQGLSGETSEADSRQVLKEKSKFNDINALNASLRCQLVGQDAAVDALVDVALKKLYVTNNNLPDGIFLFIGSASTGKTTLARAFADAKGNPRPLKIVEMSNLTLPEATNELNGTANGYDGKAPGESTEFIKANPRAVLVLQNVDKAHPQIIERCLEPLINGYWTDSYSLKKIDCRGVTFIFTTSECADVYDRPEFAILMQQDPQEGREQLIKALGNLVSKVGNRTPRRMFTSTFLQALTGSGIVYFKRHTLKDLEVIVQRKWKDLASSFSQAIGINCPYTLPDGVLQSYLLSLAPAMDAKTAINQLSKELLDPVTDILKTAENLPKSLRWALADSADFQSMTTKYFGEKDPVMLMRRKLKGLRYDSQIYQETQEWSIIWSQMRFVSVKDPEDTSGPGGVRVEVPEVRFSDIAGHKVAKARMQEVVRLLKDPEILKKHNVSVPKGMLMYGPPGTGKTMLAKALAFEADMPFLTASGTDLLSLDFLKMLFQRARKYAPSLIFLDELDIVGTRTKGGMEVIINQLLVEIDGFATSLSDPIFIVGATNLPEKIDPAIRRAGRLDIHVEIPQLDSEARMFFVEKFKQLPLDKKLQAEDIQRLVKYTAGMSGADLTQVSREVILEMVRHGQVEITLNQLVEQINTLKHGVRPNIKFLEVDRLATAFHEAGHAVVGRVLNPDLRIEQITITARGDAAGFVQLAREQDTVRTMSRGEILDDIAVLLAGRLAEHRKVGDHGISAGASSDLRKASHLAKYAISQLGMDEEFGLVSLAETDNWELVHAASGDILLRRMQAWLKQAEERCIQTLDEHWEQVSTLAQRLIDNDVVEEAELSAIMETL